MFVLFICQKSIVKWRRNDLSQRTGVALRTQLSQLDTMLPQLPQREKVVTQKFTHATTQCYEDQFNPFIPKQQQQQQQHN